MAAHKAQRPIEQAEQALRQAHRGANEDALYALAAAQRAVEAAVRAQVTAVRRAGSPWSVVAQALRLSEQEARKTFGKSSR